MVAHACNPSPGEATGFADLVNSRSMKDLMPYEKKGGFMGLEESSKVVPHVCQECVDRQIYTVCLSILFRVC